jgi:hypothetical protein
MAGYIFNLNSYEALQNYASYGVYATILKEPTKQGQWARSHLPTFADYCTMKDGDNVYFFHKRIIYGLGELINVKGDCKFCNFPDACLPNQFAYQHVHPHLLWDEGERSVGQRWLCVFKPSPHFFKTGVDIDDALSSNPTAFKMLRVFWKVSFIKLDDRENQALKDVLLKVNQEALKNPLSGQNVFPEYFQQTHNAISAKIMTNYYLQIAPILDSCASNDMLTDETALEAGILYQLNQMEPDTVQVFGKWDYLSRQVVASPFKPVDYMDKMDIFGYSFLTGFEPTRVRYLVVEVKTEWATEEDIDQLLKYVDWVKDEYCFGDYSMIHAFLVAHGFPDRVKKYALDYARRYYTIGRRPARSEKWDNLRLVQYRYDNTAKRLRFTIVP